MLIRVGGFLIAIEGAATFAVWLVRSFKSLSSLHWVLWLQQSAAYEPKYNTFMRIFLAMLTTRWSTILIVCTLVWTLIRIHKRLDDAETDRREPGLARR
jgi:hypothetical protein